MGQMPFVAVFMVTYNHEKYITQAIESVLIQKTNFPFKVFIGNDCSTDNTSAVCIKYNREYPDKIELFLNKQKIGPQKNSVQLFKACFESGVKYIAILEGDDYWTDPYKLQKQVDFLEAHPDYGLVHTDVDVFYTQTSELITNYNKKHNKNIPEKNEFENILISNYPVFTCTVLFRSDILKNIDFSVSSKFKSGDTFLWLELARKCKFKYINESIAVRQFLPESATQSRDIKKLLDFRINGYGLFKYFIDKYGCSKKVERIVHANSNKVIFRLAFDSKNKKLVNVSYKNIKQLSGKEYISNKDRFLYILNKIPFGYTIYKILKMVKA